MVLAAGRSTRMGRPKLLLPLGADTVLGRVLAGCAGFEVLVVASPEVAAVLDPAVPRIVNPEPGRGMTHSLRLADAAIPAGRTLLVVLGDKPFLPAGLVRAVAEGLAAADVAVPESGGVPGHPVGFGSRARDRIAGLPDGDGLRALRDDPALRRCTVLWEGPEPLIDVDTPEDYAALLAPSDPV